MIRNVIFDCFGTLIDTGTGSVDAVRRILKNIGLDTDAVRFYSEWKALKKEMMIDGPFFSEKELFRLSLEKLFEEYRIDADTDEAVRPMIQNLFGVRTVFSDTKEILRWLDREGISYAVGSVSDSDSMDHFLRLNGLEIGRVYTSEDLGAYKPVPVFYQKILDSTGWKPEECLFVGDDPMDDVAGPQSAGMKAALLDRRGGRIFGMNVEPDFVLHSLRELPDVLVKFKTE